MELTADEVAAALALVAAATEHDEVAPLSEQAMLRLRDGGHGLTRYDGEELAGYADLEGDTAEMAVHPSLRGRGHGRALAAALLAEAGDSLSMWAHGDLAAARALADALGFERVRALWKMRLSTERPLPDFALPEGVRLRTFEVGRDEDAWTDLNRRAFVDHPEQGRWTRADLERREREPWFDAAGFFLAERDETLVGFHWTKVHNAGLGEVYVVGVDPAAQGGGLGRSLTLAGLHHLRASGLPLVMLYVDESNTAAIKLYVKLGFTQWSTDAMFKVWNPAAKHGAHPHLPR